MKVSTEAEASEEGREERRGKRTNEKRSDPAVRGAAPRDEDVTERDGTKSLLP
jgi:hypothetical protein